jgi:hypothetical protein
MIHRHGVSRNEEATHTSLPVHDPLGVLASTQLVVEQGEHVWINPEQVEALSEQWIESGNITEAPPSMAYQQYHFFDGTERTVNWILVLDALNFCFWSEKDTPRWSITYLDQTLNGYLAQAAALTRAVAEGIPIWNAEFLSTLSEDTMATILRSTPGEGEQTEHSAPIPLFEQRVQHAREVGQVLLARYDGQFANAVEHAQYDAIQLVELLVQDFPSFRDVARFRNTEVRFFKRAQLCASDLASTFGYQQWGALSNLDQLTAFADYKLPQVLRHYGAIEYAPSLAQQIDNQELLPAGSEEEIEIRAATVWACELLRRALLNRGVRTSAAAIDLHLWLLGQQSHAMRPYHRTRTIYY